MRKCTVQVLPAQNHLFIMPIIEGDTEMYFSGANGFYNYTGEWHSTFFEDAETLKDYILASPDDVCNVDDITDPYNLISLLTGNFEPDDFDAYNETVEEYEARKAEEVKRALEIKDGVFTEYRRRENYQTIVEMKSESLSGNFDNALIVAACFDDFDTLLADLRASKYGADNYLQRNYVTHIGKRHLPYGTKYCRLPNLQGNEHEIYKTKREVPLTVEQFNI